MVDSSKECTWLLSSSWWMNGKNAARWRPLWYRCPGGLLEVATTTAPLPQRPANSCRIIMASAISVTCVTRWSTFNCHFLPIRDKFLSTNIFFQLYYILPSFVAIKMSHSDSLSPTPQQHSTDPFDPFDPVFIPTLLGLNNSKRRSKPITRNNSGRARA